MKNLTLFLITLTMASALSAMDEKKKQKALEAFYDAQTKTGKGKEKAERNFAQLYEQGTDSETVHAAAAKLGLGTEQEKTDARKKALEIAKRRIAEKQIPSSSSSGSSSEQFVDTVAPLHQATVKVDSLDQAIKTLKTEIDFKETQYSSAGLLEKIALWQELNNLKNQLKHLVIQRTGAGAKRDIFTEKVLDKEAFKDTIKNIVRLICISDVIIKEYSAEESQNAIHKLDGLANSFNSTLTQLTENHTTTFESDALATIKNEFFNALVILKNLYSPISITLHNYEDFDEMTGLEAMKPFQVAEEDWTPQDEQKLSALKHSVEAERQKRFAAARNAQVLQLKATITKLESVNL
jgi:hypothetical protein